MINFEAARDEILEWVSEAIRVPVEELELDKPLGDIGIDSLDAVHMIATIEGVIRKELPEDVIQNVTCLNDIFEMMRRKIYSSPNQGNAVLAD